MECIVERLHIGHLVSGHLLEQIDYIRNLFLLAFHHFHLLRVLGRRLDRLEKESTHDGIRDDHRRQSDVGKQESGEALAAVDHLLSLPPPPLPPPLFVVIHVLLNWPCTPERIEMLLWRGGAVVADAGTGRSQARAKERWTVRMAAYGTKFSVTCMQQLNIGNEINWSDHFDDSRESLAEEYNELPKSLNS